MKKNDIFTLANFYIFSLALTLGGASSPWTYAILDRIVHDAYKINIQSIDSSKDVSMLEGYGLDKSLRE